MNEWCIKLTYKDGTTKFVKVQGKTVGEAQTRAKLYYFTDKGGQPETETYEFKDWILEAEKERRKK